MLRDVETPFAEYVNEVGLRSMLTSAGHWTREPHEHTITSPWPNRMTIGGTKDEFVAKLAKCFVGHQRYVECVRME
jgi:hypothetical protein